MIVMNDNVLEKLACEEHVQWCEWAKSVYSEIEILLEIISKLEEDSNMELDSSEISAIFNNREKLNRWKELFVPYEDLSDSEKEKDRVYARKVYEICSENKELL